MFGAARTTCADSRAGDQHSERDASQRRNAFECNKQGRVPRGCLGGHIGVIFAQDLGNAYDAAHALLDAGADLKHRTLAGKSVRDYINDAMPKELVKRLEGK